MSKRCDMCGDAIFDRWTRWEDVSMHLCMTCFDALGIGERLVPAWKRTPDEQNINPEEKE